MAAESGHLTMSKAVESREILLDCAREFARLMFQPVERASEAAWSSICDEACEFVLDSAESSSKLLGGGPPCAREGPEHIMGVSAWARRLAQNVVAEPDTAADENTPAAEQGIFSEDALMACDGRAVGAIDLPSADGAVSTTIVFDTVASTSKLRRVHMSLAAAREPVGLSNGPLTAPQSSEISLENFQMRCAVSEDGRFGMQVWAARCNWPPYAPVAIKKLKKSAVVDSGLLRELNEQRALFECLGNDEGGWSPVGNLGSFTDDSYIYKALEWIPGGTLGGLLESVPGGKGLSLDDSILYTSQIVLALDHLHSQDIAYQVLTPDNVLLNKDGYVVLSEASLSMRRIGAASVLEVAGSSGYIAPEELPPKKSVTPAIDWWYLGLLCFELLSGRGNLPFVYSTPEQLLTLINNGRPVRCPVDWPKPVRDFVVSCLCRHPEQRLKGGSPRAMLIFENIDWDQLESRSIAVPWIPDPASDANGRVATVVPDEEEQGDKASGTLSGSSPQRISRGHEGTKRADAQRDLLRRSDALSALTWQENQAELTLMGRVTKGRMPEVQSIYSDSVTPLTRRQPGYQVDEGRQFRYILHCDELEE